MEGLWMVPHWKNISYILNRHPTRCVCLCAFRPNSVRAWKKLVSLWRQHRLDDAMNKFKKCPNSRLDWTSPRQRLIYFGADLVKLKETTFSNLSFLKAHSRDFWQKKNKCRRLCNSTEQIELKVAESSGARWSYHFHRRLPTPIIQRG